MAERRQRHWCDRDLHAQLHRFARIASGRKVPVARSLAEATRRADVPIPLGALVDQIAQALRTPGTPPLSAFPSATVSSWRNRTLNRAGR